MLCPKNATYIGDINLAVFKCKKNTINNLLGFYYIGD